MTQQELFARLAAGDYTVRDGDRVGTVQQVLFFGREIRVLVLYPGRKFEVAYEENEQVEHRNVRYMRDLG